MTWRKILLGLMIGSSVGVGSAQELPAPSIGREADSVDRVVESIVVPQIRTSVKLLDQPASPAAGVSGTPQIPEISATSCAISKVSARVTIENEVAETLLEFQCTNVGKQLFRAPIAVPLPANARLPEKTSPFHLKGGNRPAEEVVPPRQALPVWQNLAKQLADPAPIEFFGYPLLKTGPVELQPGESQPVRVNYIATCPSEGSRYDYVLPRSESVEYAVPWSMQVDITSDQPIATVYSPSHKLETRRLSAHSIQVKVGEKEAAQPGSFWLSYLLDQGGLSATLFTQSDDATPGADGTFLFLAGVPAGLSEEKAISRELTLALDRSGSMQGKKIDQVREAAVQVLDGLKDGESFNIITYNDQVDSFSEKPVRKTAETFEAACRFIEDMKPRGGTNLHAALLESVKQQPTPRSLPIVLFLTDGLPTVGETEEVKIRDVVATQNPHNQRFFTVGVGVDVNTPLLETIASETRAQPTFVLPTENVKTRLSQVFESLERPILTDAVLETGEPGGSKPKRIRDVFPEPLPDLFQDDQLVVLGRYQGTEPLTFRIRGNYLGEEKTFQFTFPIKDRPSSPFVSRLWATQKIAALVQEIRKSGATADPYDILANPKQDPKLKQLAEEILQLTTRYGILTEYTAFLAQDGSRWLDQNEQLERAYRNFDERAVKTRVGLSSVNQSINNTLLQRQYHLNSANGYWDANMRRVAVPNVQQFGNGAFFLRGTTWVDGRLVDRPNIQPEQVVTFGSSDYQRILSGLVQEQKHTPLSLGDVLMEIDNKTVLIRSRERPAAPPETTPAKGVPAKGRQIER